MKIIPRVSLEKIKFNIDNEVHFVIELTAPPVNWQARRMPVCLMLVADISGSMSGDKLEQAKQSAHRIIDNLQDGDFCGAAVFEDVAHLVSSPIQMNKENRQILKSKISDIATTGCTNFSDGLVLGLKEVNGKELPENIIIRVIMLTDGLANRGVSDNGGMLRVLKSNLGRATCSAFGYGQDAAQDFLATFAQEGRGNYAFIKDAKAALSTFAKELGGLLSMYARNIRIELTSEEFKHVLVSDISDRETMTNGMKFTLPDIIGDETRHIVLNCKIPAISQADALFEAIRKPFASLKISYDLLREDGSIEAVSETLMTVIEFVNSGDEQQAVSKDLDEVIGRAQLIRAQLEAEQKANAGDYSGASELMSGIAVNLDARGLKKLATTSNKLGSRVSSASAYTSSAAYRKSTYSVATRGVGASGADDEAKADVVLTNESLSNAAQESMVEAFVSNITPTPASK